LFLRVGYGHYYYGNYYGAAYAHAGFTPWAGYAAGHYDPVYSAARVANRGNPNWASNLTANIQAHANGTATATNGSLGTTAQLQQSGAKLQTVSPSEFHTHNHAGQQMTWHSQQMTNSSVQLHNGTMAASSFHSNAGIHNGFTGSSAHSNANIHDGFTGS